MTKQIKTLDQLKDSRLMFDKKMPAFGYMLILIVAAFLAGALIWSIHTPKAYMITAQGTVTSKDSNYVMSGYTGEIGDCHMQEGQLVEKGDVLFTIKSTDYDMQQEQLEESKAAYEKQISQYELLVKSIKDDTNYFDASNSEDNLYYSTYEAYKSQVAQNKLDTNAYKAYGYTDEQIAIDGLTESVYGNIKGKVIRVDSNLTTQESAEGTTQVFRVKNLPETDYLVSRTGDKVDLANGMTAVARIEYDKVTYFNYVLEKLGFRAK